MSQTPQKRKWWEKPANAWKSCGALAVLVLGGLIALQWVDSTDKDSIRNIIFALGGVGAFLGVWLASIRNMDFTRQVDEQTKQISLFARQVDTQGNQINLLAEQVKTQTRQTELQTQQVRSETLSRCVEQIGDKDSLTIRTAGMLGLRFLAQDHQDNIQFLKHICDILQGFINEHAPARRRQIAILYRLSQAKAVSSVWNLQTVMQKARLSESAKERVNEWDADWQEHKTEVEQSINTFGRIVAIAPKTLRGPDLSARYLPSLQISSEIGDKLNLRRTKFIYAFLPHARLSRIDLRQAQFQRADLSWSEGWNVNLERAFFSRANLTKVDFIRANLSSARFWNTDLRKTRWMNIDLKGANFDGANLEESVRHDTTDDDLEDIGKESSEYLKPVTPEWLKAQGAKNCDKAKFSEDSDD